MSEILVDNETVDSNNDVEEESKESLKGSEMCDGRVDNEVSQYDFVNDLTDREIETAAINFSSCADGIIKSCDEINQSLTEPGDTSDVNSSGVETHHYGESHVNSESIQFETTSGDLTDSKGSWGSHNSSFNGVCPINDINFSVDCNINKHCGSAIETIFENNFISADIPNGVSKAALNTELKNKHFSHNRKKLKEILLALRNNDKASLRKAAITKGGLLNDDIRRKAWPKLVGVDILETSPRPCLKEIEAHPYYSQVVLDVNRSLKRFPPSIQEAQRLMMLDQLVFLIMRVLCRHPEMHYYQGYHDICVTFLLVLGEETAYYVVEKLSRTHLNVFMERNMEPTIHLLEHMYVLIGKENPLLKDFLLKSEVGVAYCLSWLITWFGHVLSDYDMVVRLFDLFIVSHPWMPMYLTSAIVLHRESEVLKQDCDMASVHSLLSNIPDGLPFEGLILDAISLREDYKPRMIAIEHPYVPKNKMQPKKKWNLFQTVTKTIKYVVPTSRITIPIVIAAAVVVTAVLYQAYKY